MIRFSLAAAIAVAALNASAEPVPTDVTVRVIARDAKAIYEAVGGAWVTITDQTSGKVLASGLHTGKSSGSTQKIMVEPRKRGETTFATPDAAMFHTTIPLEKPTVVEVAAEGPVGHPQAKRAASKTLLLVPGEHITGDGIVLEIHGLVVTAGAPKPVGGDLELDATVVMACGCPVTPGGTWNADEFEVTARLIAANGDTIATVPMRWAGGRWSASIPRPELSPVAIEVVAGHTPTANFGMHTLDLP